jgi:hypothetical protein
MEPDALYAHVPGTSVSLGVVTVFRTDYHFYRYEMLAMCSRDGRLFSSLLERNLVRSPLCAAIFSC